MRYSVIIPLYNKAPYVAKAIGSVLSQTFTDFELIVVDDGSKDDSFEVARKVVEGHNCCHLYRQKNGGVSVARNHGVMLSHGEYVCFLDADDWWAPTFLEEMSQLIEAYPEAGIYGTSYTIVNETKHKTRVSPIGVEPDFKQGYINYCQVYAKTLAMPLWTGAVCIPRGVFDELKGFNPQLKMGEDFDLWIRIAIKYKVAFLNKPLAYYNQDVEVAHRAIGTLPAPATQFAFCADYLQEEMGRNEELKHIVECVQIICLRNYFLSKNYHAQAVTVLEKMDLEPHKGNAYADYLHRPVWQTRMIDKAAGLKKLLKYGK